MKLCFSKTEKFLVFFNVLTDFKLKNVFTSILIGSVDLNDVLGFIFYTHSFLCDQNYGFYGYFWSKNMKQD